MSENTQNPVSNQAVLTAVQAISRGLTSLDQKFTGLDGKLGDLDQKLTDHIEESKQTHEDILSAVNTSFTAMTVEIHDIKQDISGIKATMVTKEELKQELVKVVTKDYLDDKLTDLKGDLVGLARKADHKTVVVVNALKAKQILTSNEAESILHLEPFPQ